MSLRALRARIDRLEARLSRLPEPTPPGEQLLSHDELGLLTDDELQSMIRAARIKDELRTRNLSKPPPVNTEEEVRARRAEIMDEEGELSDAELDLLSHDEIKALRAAKQALHDVRARQLSRPRDQTR